MSQSDREWVYLSRESECIFPAPSRGLYTTRRLSTTYIYPDTSHIRCLSSLRWSIGWLYYPIIPIVESSYIDRSPWDGCIGIARRPATGDPTTPICGTVPTSRLTIYRCTDDDIFVLGECRCEHFFFGIRILEYDIKSYPTYSCDLEFLDQFTVSRLGDREHPLISTWLERVDRLVIDGDYRYIRRWMECMRVYHILPDSTSGSIDKESIQRIRELCRENHNTPEYESERDEPDSENMFEISEFLHILILSLTPPICKNLHSLSSFVKNSLGLLYSDVYLSWRYQSDSRESPMRPMEEYSAISSIRSSHQGIGSLQEMVLSKMRQNSDENSQQNLLKYHEYFHVQPISVSTRLGMDELQSVGKKPNIEKEPLGSFLLVYLNYTILDCLIFHGATTSDLTSLIAVNAWFERDHIAVLKSSWFHLKLVSSSLRWSTFFSSQSNRVSSQSNRVSSHCTDLRTSWRSWVSVIK